jgi:hypothetical protein
MGENNTACFYDMLGAAMTPTIQPGQRLTTVEVSDYGQIDPGTVCFVIDRSPDKYVRRLYPIQDGFLMVSDHEDQKLFPPFQRKIVQLNKVYKVVDPEIPIIESKIKQHDTNSN